MADMFDSGRTSFNQWAAQTVAPNGRVFSNQFYGEFDPHMTAEAANILSDHVGKITDAAQAAFKRGWTAAQEAYLAGRKEDV
jgi:hypothetical protein